MLLASLTHERSSVFGFEKTTYVESVMKVSQQEPEERKAADATAKTNVFPPIVRDLFHTGSNTDER